MAAAVASLRPHSHIFPPPLQAKDRPNPSPHRRTSRPAGHRGSARHAPVANSFAGATSTGDVPTAASFAVGFSPASALTPDLPASSSTPIPVVASEASAHDDLPLSHRIWHLYCQGHSFCAIARQLDLERHYVARQVHNIQRALADEHTADLLLTRDRAIDAAYQLLAATWDKLDAESHREDLAWQDFEQAYAALTTPNPSASASHSNAPARPPTAPRYRAQSARLLAVGIRALTQAIRLQGLDSPATQPAKPACTTDTSASRGTPASSRERPPTTTGTNWHNSQVTPVATPGTNWHIFPAALAPTSADPQSAPHATGTNWNIPPTTPAPSPLPAPPSPETAPTLRTRAGATRGRPPRIPDAPSGIAPAYSPASERRPFMAARASHPLAPQGVEAGGEDPHASPAGTSPSPAARHSRYRRASRAPTLLPRQIYAADGTS
jgi:hypothetical protein